MRHVRNSGKRGQGWMRRYKRDGMIQGGMRRRRAMNHQCLGGFSYPGYPQVSAIPSDKSLSVHVGPIPYASKAQLNIGIRFGDQGETLYPD